MTIIQFLKKVFVVSQKNLQNSTQPSGLDIANAQPIQEEFVTTEEEPLSPIDEQTAEGKNNIPETETQESIETIISSEDVIDGLQDFVKEIDKEYATEKFKGSTDIAEVEVVVAEPEETVSLLDNSPYMSLADSCCDLIKELDKLKSETNKDLVDLVISRIKEGLFSSGAVSIAEEPSYDVIRHTAIGKAIVRKGTPITSTIEPGIAIGAKVMIKAKVQI